MNRTNILLIIPHLGSGGAQQVFREQFVFYRQHANVVGCVFNWEGAFANDKMSGIVSLDVPGGHNLFQKAVFFWKRIKRLRRLKQQHNIDVSISHLEGADYVNVISSGREKTILWIHGTKKFDQEIQGTLGWLRKRKLIPLLYRRTARIIAVSEGIRQELIREYRLPPAMVITIHNGIDMSDIQNKSRQENARAKAWKGSLTLITHCRLARQKNLTEMIEIFAAVRKKRPARLILLGDGEQRSSLLRLAKAHHLSVYSAWDLSQAPEKPDVYFLGHQTNPFSFLSQASVYVMTSDWEGFPLSLCEAMACGVPVLAADCYTGPREILAPQLKADQPIESPLITPFGMLMPMADAKHRHFWVNAICQLGDNESMRNLASAAAIIRAMDFDCRKVELKWLEIIAGSGIQTI
ncbi:MAG TPA: glycosyltransferase [Cyclobacteriaceae bacterium]|nr:glycosyltransferase [Cyclobacteriaceae bacterium]